MSFNLISKSEELGKIDQEEKKLFCLCHETVLEGNYSGAIAPHPLP